MPLRRTSYPHAASLSQITGFHTVICAEKVVKLKITGFYDVISDQFFLFRKKILK